MSSCDVIWESTRLQLRAHERNFRVEGRADVNRRTNDCGYRRRSEMRGDQSCDTTCVPFLNITLFQNAQLRPHCIIIDIYHIYERYTRYLLRNMRAPFGDRRRIRSPTTLFLGNEKNVSRNRYSSPHYPPSAPTRKRSKEMRRNLDGG